MAREIGTVGVVGLGTMGAGIAEVVARAGLDVVGVETGDDALAAGRGHLERSTARAVDRGRLAEDERDGLVARVRFTTSLGDLAGCDLVVEAVPERLDLKRDLFARLDAVVRPDAVLATNTSSLSVTEVAAATAEPGRVVGMHFFNPAPVQRLVEVVGTVVADAEVLDAVVALARRLGKEPVVVRDRAGFVANALLFGYLGHAVRLLEQGRATRDDLDAAMTLGAGLPMGPFALMDLIGLDTCQQVLATMHDQGRDALHAPPPLLRQLVAAGLVGRKSGRGFWTYEAPGSPVVVPDAMDAGGAAAGPDPAPRPVRRAVVCGTGPEADAVGGLLAAAGLDVVAADDVAAADLSGTDLVVHVPEDQVSGDAAAAGLAALAGRSGPGTVLATTATAVPLVELARGSGRPADVVGLHLPHPALGTGVRFAEVVTTVLTAPDAAATVADVATRGGARAVPCPDRAGGLVDALLVPYLNDAVRMVESGYASADDVDTAMRSGCGYPRGPVEVLDAVGLDVVLAVQRRVHAASGEPGHAPAPMLAHLVAAGRVGRGGPGLREAG